MNTKLDKKNPIAVFDSGAGGISVLRELVAIMPGEDFVYFGDSKNAPYGMKSTEEVRRLTIEHIGRFVENGAKGICVACNTATSAAVSDLRRIYPDIPLVGIEPALKPAVQVNVHPKVLVMATPMTIREEKFQSLLAKYESQAEIIQMPCPGLMEFIESGNFDTPEIETFLDQLLWDYENNVCDCAVLGCTHYPFVADKIQKALGDKTKLFDGARGTAKELKRRIVEAGLLRDERIKGEVIFTSSDDSEDKIRLFQKLLERPILL